MTSFNGPPAQGQLRYRQVANQLREQIRSGAYAPGSTLPAESELVARFGWDRATIRRGIAILRQEGLVDVQPGRGSFVRQRRLITSDVIAGLRYEHAHMAEDGSDSSLIAAMTGTPADVRVDVDYRHVPADDELVEAFGGPLSDLRSGEDLLLRRSYRVFVDGRPHSLIASYLLGEMVDHTELADPACERPGRGTMAQLYHALGIVVDGVDVDMQARAATPEESAYFEIADAAAVLSTRRVMLHRGRAVAVDVSVVPGDRVRIRIRVELDAAT